MNNSKGIFKSNKHIRDDTETKKVQLYLHSSHKLIDSDEEERPEPPPPNTQEPERTKRSKTGGSNKSIKFSGGAEAGQGGSSNRGCLKNGSERKIQITGEDEEDVRSSKSIKFNIKNNDVFVYSLETKEKKKKTLPGYSPKQADPAEGECC
jgi:hypothetical protein